MNVNLKWGLITLASVVVAVAVTWVVAGHFNQPPDKDTDRPGTDKEAAKAEDSVKLVMAMSKPLIQYSTRGSPTVMFQLLAAAKLKTPSGKKIVVERIPLSSVEMIDGVMNGTIKAHILVPGSDVYLDQADQEWKNRTGKTLTTDRAEFVRQPYVLAVRRPMAEAMGWPGKDIGWENVIEIAKDGWKAAGHPEWGPLKMLLLNPDYSDAGSQTVMSIVYEVLGKSKGLTAEDLDQPALVEAFKAINNAVVWYPWTFDDLLRNEALTVPSRCDMTFLPEHQIRALNDRSARRQAPPDWVPIYPPKGTIVDTITGAVVQREWVTQEQREAAAALTKLFRNAKAQEKLAAMGYRPVLPDITLPESLTKAMGIDPKRPQQALHMPPAEVIYDCLKAWDKAWKMRSGESAPPLLAVKPSTATPVGMKKNSQLTPTVICVRRAKPSSVTIRHSDTKKVKGSGVVVDARGYAVTNAHVVGNDKTVAVSFFGEDNKIYAGEVAFVARDRDLAIVRILAPGKLPAVKFGNSDDLEAGETVVAIGNPLGYTSTVTVGIVSALNREITIPSGAVLKKVIQTDASINPGNSGGPLLDIDGDLVGIVFAQRSGAENIAFAIPVNHVRAYVKKCLPN
jgi:S1-C subfamily serine protease